MIHTPPSSILSWKLFFTIFVRCYFFSLVLLLIITSTKNQHKNNYRTNEQINRHQHFYISWNLTIKDRKSTRLNQSPDHLVCRLLLEKKKKYPFLADVSMPPEIMDTAPPRRLRCSLHRTRASRRFFHRASPHRSPPSTVLPTAYRLLC